MRGPEHLGKVLVLGLGKSGKSAARHCASLLGTRVESLFIAAGRRTDDSLAFLESLAGEGVKWEFGDDALAGCGERFDLCIASPGIPFWHELYVCGAELSREIISEVEFAWRESNESSTWVAITGTNGKTTTTSLCAHILRECGFAADAVGNIGDVCLDAVAAGNTRVYVAEVSSYQLASTVDFAPDVAVLLNITPDHIHWHQTLDAYAQAKFKLLDNLGKTGIGENARAWDVDGMREKSGRGALRAPAERSEARFEQGDVPSDTWALQARAHGVRPYQTSPASHFHLGASAGVPVAILDATNDVVRGKVRELRAVPPEERAFAYIPMGTADGIHGDMRAKCGAENAAFLDGGDVLHVALDGVDHELLPASDLQIAGEHNASNALAAAAVAVALGADDVQIAAALASFKPLAHRIEPCGSVAGTECYNDSKATNVDATLKALAAFPGRRVIVLLGGDDKGTDLSELVQAAHAHAVAAVCYGEGGPRFAEALAERGSACVTLPVTLTRRADDLGDSEDVATRCARVTGSVTHVQPSAGFACLQAAHMEDALDAALGIAQPGDIVLLSPACASFDEFRSFEHRGDVFKQLVAARAEALGA